MSKKLLIKKDTYYTLSDLRAMDNKWVKDQKPVFSELFVPTLIGATCAIIGKALSKAHYKAVGTTISVFITLADYQAKVLAYDFHDQVKHAILLLEATNEKGAVRFRMSDYLLDSEIIPTISVTYNSNY